MVTSKQRAQSFDQLSLKMEEAFGRAVKTAHDRMVVRIFSEGRNTAGQLMGTYSKSYKKLREKKRLKELRRVHLVFTGFLQSDFSTTLIKLSTFNYGVGIKNAENLEKIKQLEERYGTIFKFSKEELEVYRNILRLELRAELNKIFGIR